MDSEEGELFNAINDDANSSNTIQNDNFFSKQNKFLILSFCLILFLVILIIIIITLHKSGDQIEDHEEE